MAVSITPIAEAILSHNPVYTDLQSDNYLSGSNTKQVFKIILKSDGGAALNNETLTINFNDETMVLTFKSTPDNSGLQLPLFNPAVNASYDAVEAALLKNYYLTQYFVMTVTTVVNMPLSTWGREYIFTQRNNAQEFRYASFASSAPTKTEASLTTTFNTLTIKNGYKAFLEIYQQDNIAAARKYNLFVTRLESHMQLAGFALFDLSSVFRKWTQLKPDFPTFIDTIYPCLNVMKYYYLRFGEMMGNPPTIGETGTQPATVGTDKYKKVILGGMPFLAVPGNTFYADYINASQNKFLTMQKSGKTVMNKAAKHFLYHYLKTASVVNVKGTLYVDDGTTVNFNGPTSGSSAAAERIYGYNVGYNDLNLDALLTGTQNAMKYEVWIENGSATRISEKFMFEVDTRYYQYNHYFYCHNAFGGIDTIWMTGDIKEIPEFSGVEIQKAVVTTYTEGNIETSDSQLRKGFEASSGWKKYKEEMENIRILLQSNHVRWLPDAKILAGYTKPIKINIAKEAIGEWPSDLENIFGLEFSFKLSHFEWL